MAEVVDFAEQAVECQHFNDLGRLTLAALKHRGIAMVSYHHMPPPGAFDRKPYVSVVASGYPTAWVERYKDQQYYRVDPIPKRAMRAPFAFLWSETFEDTDLRPDEQRYLLEMRAQHLGEGLAVPVFGPRGRNGYVGLGCGQNVWRLSVRERLRLQGICQASHLVYCRLLAKALPADVTLSGREDQILRWIAKGKSNAVMAEILALSPNTIDTYVRRIFRKLEVSDRVTAALRGLALGVIE